VKGSSGEDCGRPKKNGQPCQNVRVYGFASCHRHLTDEERSRRPEIVMPEFPPEPTAPACWLWPIPEEPAAEGHRLLLHWQVGRCAICGTHPGTGLVLDHDHATGLVRGYLCRSCNGREAGDHPGHELFGLYRRRHPAGILGLRLRYVDPYTRRPAEPEGPRRRSGALSMLRVEDDSGDQ
jgi:hypothetical protein